MKIVIKRSVSPKTRGQFYFAIIAKNGKIVAQSETYKTKRSAVSTALIIRGANLWTIIDPFGPL